MTTTAVKEKPAFKASVAGRSWFFDESALRMMLSKSESISLVDKGFAFCWDWKRDLIRPGAECVGDECAEALKCADGTKHIGTFIGRGRLPRMDPMQFLNEETPAWKHLLATLQHHSFTGRAMSCASGPDYEDIECWTPAVDPKESEARYKLKKPELETKKNQLGFIPKSARLSDIRAMDFDSDLAVSFARNSFPKVALRRAVEAAAPPKRLPTREIAKKRPVKELNLQYSMPELRRLAHEAGVTFPSSIVKLELTNLLREACFIG